MNKHFNDRHSIRYTAIMLVSLLLTTNKGNYTIFNDPTDHLSLTQPTHKLEQQPQTYDAWSDCFKHLVSKLPILYLKQRNCTELCFSTVY